MQNAPFRAITFTVDECEVSHAAVALASKLFTSVAIFSTPGDLIFHINVEASWWLIQSDASLVFGYKLIVRAAALSFFGQDLGWFTTGAFI